MDCTQVADHIKNIVPTVVPESIQQTNELSELRRTIKEKETEVNVLTETNRILNAKIKELTKELELKTVKSKKIKDDRGKLQTEAKILKNDIESYKEKINSLNASIAKIILH